jgi:membrane-associated phospholipid phosphatase
VVSPGAPVPRRTMFLALLAGYAFFTFTYLPINRASVGRDAHRLFLPGETGIPFVPAAEYLYATGYFLPLLLLWRPPDRRRLLRLVGGFGLVLATAYATYAAFPVTLDRPAFVPDTLATWLLSIEYLDPTYNHFPSLHVALGCLTFLAVERTLGRARAPVAALLFGMSLSTLFVKQHYLVDVLFGVGLAYASWAMAGRLVRHSSQGEADALPFRKALR